MTVIRYITDAKVVSKILTHLGLPTSAPPIAPARHPANDEPELALDYGDCTDGEQPVPPHPKAARAPPEDDYEVDADVPTASDSDGFWGA